MIGFLRLFLFGFAGLTVLYLLLVIYNRSLTREKLEDEWAEKGEIGDRDTYVENGLKAYKSSFRPKLLLLVYILPLIAFGAVFFMTNFM
ncbi:hypothetical protein [Celeribacter sp.]|uniref:hypothetical protein n=1 Tax=Celeribacter sp. TaxID=1890673 RepID=UPI003A91CA05